MKKLEKNIINIIIFISVLIHSNYLYSEILTEAENNFIKYNSNIAKSKTLKEKYLTSQYINHICQTYYKDRYSDISNKLKNEGLEYYKKKLDKLAVAKYEEALRYYGCGDIYYFYGNSLMNIQDYDSAIKAFKLAADSFPGYEIRNKSYYNLACSYSLVKKNKQAYEFLKMAILSGYGNIQYINTDPDLIFLRTQEDWETRYAELKNLYDKGNDNFIANKRMHTTLSASDADHIYTFFPDGHVEWEYSTFKNIKNWHKTGKYQVKNYMIIISWLNENGEKGIGKPEHCFGGSCSYTVYESFKQAINESEVLSWYEITTIDDKGPGDWWKIENME